ncbi:hypothetical protein [Flammeovirga sp. SJP92]|uniref:hypothetical protein n=1 Tax=Flammeovirga sp. SJP92 TaxID=1775430 RepID=UPI000795485F|nr:hypothetical protein [Flammeovirga sp. SJP92]KXX69242.1 hypothetical protein AVL50_16400 [Flammeovirga sp. SJP92]
MKLTQNSISIILNPQGEKTSITFLEREQAILLLNVESGSVFSYKCERPIYKLKNNKILYVYFIDGSSILFDNVDDFKKVFGNKIKYDCTLVSGTNRQVISYFYELKKEFLVEIFDEFDFVESDGFEEIYQNKSRNFLIKHKGKWIMSLWFPDTKSLELYLNQA